MTSQRPRTGTGTLVMTAFEMAVEQPFAEASPQQKQQQRTQPLQCSPTCPKRPSNQQAWMETAKGKAAASSCDQQKRSATKTSQRFKRRPKHHSTSVL